MERMTAIVRAVLCAALILVACSSGRETPASGSGPEMVEGGAVFRYHNTGARKVHLVGDFNNWSPTSDPMSDQEGDGNWTLFYPLRPGAYQYKFVVDGVRWIPDPRNPVSVPDGFSGRNSVVKMPTASAPLP